MAIHDYVIDNSTGANVRADINEVLKAILTNNGGSTDPATVISTDVGSKAFSFWADTNTNFLKIRNAGDNAWINLFSLDGSILLADGSASSPSLSFSDDTNTGIFSSAADTFNVATGGVERMELGATTVFNEDGADVDFRIEGDTEANLFYLDAGNNRIGIGTSSPQSTVNIMGVLEFNAFDNASGSGGRFTSKGFLIGDAFTAGKTSSDDRNMIIWNERGLDLVFATSDTERMKIDSSGRVLIGTTSASSANSFSDNLIVSEAGNVGMQFLGNDNNSNYASIYLGDPGEKQRAFFEAQLGANGTFTIGSSGTGPMRFNNNGAERFRINSSGFLQYNNTVDIGGVFQLTASGITNLAAHKLARFNYNSSADVTGIEMRHARGGLSGFSGKMISFTGNDSTEEGSIVINVTSTSFNTSSDYRLKENETAIIDGITKLKQLKPYRFNFKKDPDVKVDGFFAHEVAPVVPIAVTGEKDAMEAETRYEEGDTIPEGKVIGDPKTYSTTTISPQQLDHSKLVPLLVAAVQELIGKVEALEAA